MIPDVSILAPYVASAWFRVGRRRTDPADIARILAEFGAHGSAAENAIETAIAGQYPPVAIDEVAFASACQLDRDARRMAATTTASSRGYGDLAQTGTWSVATAAFARVTGLAESEARWSAIQNDCAAWWTANASAIDVLCLRAAHRLLVEREATV